MAVVVDDTILSPVLNEARPGPSGLAADGVGLRLAGHTPLNDRPTVAAVQKALRPTRQGVQGARARQVTGVCGGTGACVSRSVSPSSSVASCGALVDAPWLAADEL